MLNLGNIKLAETLPQSISSDEQVKDICKALEQRLSEIKKQSAFVLLLPRLNELSETVLQLTLKKSFHTFQILLTSEKI